MKIREISKDLIPVTIKELFVKHHQHICHIELRNHVYKGSVKNIEGTEVEMDLDGKSTIFDIYDIDSLFVEE